MTGGRMPEQTLYDILKEFVGPATGSAAGGVVGYVVGKRRLDAEADAVSLDAITRHFTALIDGYERRINDLTAEINKLRDEVVSLRLALDAALTREAQAIADGRRDK